MRHSLSAIKKASTLAIMFSTVVGLSGSTPSTSFATSVNTDTLLDLKEQPDIVVIQSEAFMDLDRLNEFKFSKPILTNYHKWATKGQQGLLSVPVNGGMTCNSEFEFLTGIRSAAVAANPYVDIISKDKIKVDSLPWQLKQVGYTTIGIHSYQRTYFNRDIVYPLLGIDSFISMETFKTPSKYGHWIADRECFAQIKTVLDKKGTTDTPKFIYNVTVQNHAPFSYKSSTDALTVSSKVSLTKQSKAMLQNYASGLRILDTDLNTFMSYIKARKKHTIVVFYGDHQPPSGYGMFNGTKEIVSKKDKFKTNYFIYDNKKEIGNVKDTNITNLRFILVDKVPALAARDLSGLEVFNGLQTMEDYSNDSLKEAKNFYKNATETVLTLSINK